MMLLFTDICGNIMLGVAVVGIAMGFFVINKVMDIEV
jgi:Flp pilus assembly protein TadB